MRALAIRFRQRPPYIAKEREVKREKVRAAVVVLAIAAISQAALGAPVYSETVDVYTILPGNLPGPPSAVWNHTFDGSVNPITEVLLTIVAEGVDGPGQGLDGEQDAVYFEGHFLGYLQDQGFYYEGLDIKAGPGALGEPKTELTTSVFNLDPSWISGLTTASVQVEAKWIVEVETSTLTVVPEPGTILLLGLGGLALLRKRR